MSSTAKVSDTKTWLVMLYMAADDVKDSRSHEATLENDCCRMITALEVLSKDGKLAADVTVVALFDNNRRQNKMDCWSPSVKVLTAGNKWVDRSDDIKRREDIFFKPPDASPGDDELNTGDPETLATFIRWSLDEYPSTYTMLAIIGHGGGWAPTWPKLHAWKRSWADGANGLCPDYSSESAMSTKGLGSALAAGLEPRHEQQADARLNVVFLDACLMGMIEVAYELHEDVEFLIAGENLLWPTLRYKDYLHAGVLNKHTEPAELAATIVRNYNKRSPVKTWSLAAIDLSKSADLHILIRAINTLAKSIINDSGNESMLQRIVTAYQKTQKFDYDGDTCIEPMHDAYIDLQHFAQNLFDQFDDDPSLLHEDAGMVKSQARALIREINPKPKPESIVHAGQAEASLSETSDTEQTKPAAMNLNDAYGLSIYLPLGEVDTREIPIPRKDGGPIPYIDCYNHHHLKFAEAAPAWVEMVKVLTDKLWPKEDAPEPKSQSYKTPRLQHAVKRKNARKL